MKQKLLFLLGCILSLPVIAQEADSAMMDQYIEKQFVIVQSTTKYPEALKTAKAAAQQLKLKLDLRGLKPHKETGLTWSSKTCNTDWFGYPCYVARGRYDDGAYVSIEYSSAYSGFKEGYYIVIVAGGDAGNSLVKSSLTKAQKIYRDAYAKLSRVYVGCMH
jgi:hypothetical protein